MNAEIREWLRKGNEAGHFVERLSDIVPNPKIDFKAGDRVVFTNDYGVSFVDQTIIAIGKHNDLWKYGHCIYLDKDSYWFPVKPDSLSFGVPESKYKNIKDLQFLGVNWWGYPIYKDKESHLWADISSSNTPNLYSIIGDDMDGEPYMPITNYYPDFYKDL